MYNQQLENAVRQFQRESHIEETGVMDLATRQLLNELATTSGFAPTTEFDRAENWPPAPPPYTRAEYQLDRTQAEQAMPQPADGPARRRDDDAHRSEEHTSELQSLMRISYAVFCLKKNKHNNK